MPRLETHVVLATSAQKVVVAHLSAGVGGVGGRTAKLDNDFGMIKVDDGHPGMVGRLLNQKTDHAPLAIGLERAIPLRRRERCLWAHCAVVVDLHNLNAAPTGTF